jgi:hypothetical protein
VKCPRMEVVPVSFAEACAFIEEHHRHHRPPVRWKFGCGVSIDGRLVGVATVGRPVARGLQDRYTLEVTRCCTDGTPHAASKLYAACWRAARALGYRRLITYTLLDEAGTSLRAAGWRVVGQTRGGSWDTPARRRVDKHPTGPKLRWEADFT